jgi:predicted DNA binding protein
MEKKLYFDNYRGAMHFLKKVGAGKIKPRTDKKGFLWDPDSGQLTQEQLEIIAEAYLGYFESAHTITLNLLVINVSAATTIGEYPRSES